jgi:chitinase
MMDQTGVQYYSLAFVLGRPDECVAAWQGGQSVERQTLLLRDLEKLRAQGGDVIVSFGGWAGDELAMVCDDVDSLTAQYQLVIDTYNLTRLDFDIEGNDIDDAESLARRSLAIANLQTAAESDGRALYVSFTLPVLPDGLTQDGLKVLQSALDAGVEIDMVNIMTMNYGSGYPPDAMGPLSIEAAHSLFEQLATLFSDKSESELWAMIGLTPMIGMNDTAPQHFSLDDAQMIVDFAVERGLGQLAMWSIHRDRACPANASGVMNNCSGIVQDDFAFSTLFNRINASE